MKMLVTDPIQAARRYGGATWEPEVGWWTHLGQGRSPPLHARQLRSARDALYVPSRESDSKPVRSDQARFAA